MYICVCMTYGSSTTRPDSSGNLQRPDIDIDTHTKQRIRTHIEQNI